MYMLMLSRKMLCRSESSENLSIAVYKSGIVLFNRPSNSVIRAIPRWL